MESSKDLKHGDDAPDFTLKGVDGKENKKKMGRSLFSSIILSA